MKNILFLGKSKSNDLVARLLINNRLLSNKPAPRMGYLSSDGVIYEMPDVQAGSFGGPVTMDADVNFGFIVVALDLAESGIVLDPTANNSTPDSSLATQQALIELTRHAARLDYSNTVLWYIGSPSESICSAGYETIRKGTDFKVFTTERIESLPIRLSPYENIDCVNPLILGRNSKEEAVLMHHTPYSVYCMVSSRLFSSLDASSDYLAANQAAQGIWEHNVSVGSTPEAAVCVVYPNERLSLNALTYFSAARVIQSASNDLVVIAGSIKACFKGSLMSPREIVEKSAVIDNWYARPQFSMDAKITYWGPEGRRCFLEVMAMGEQHPAVFTEVPHPQTDFYTVLIEFKFPPPERR